MVASYYFYSAFWILCNSIVRREAFYSSSYKYSTHFCFITYAAKINLTFSTTYLRRFVPLLLHNKAISTWALLCYFLVCHASSKALAFFERTPIQAKSILDVAAKLPMSWMGKCVTNDWRLETNAGRNALEILSIPAVRSLRVCIVIISATISSALFFTFRLISIFPPSSIISLFSIFHVFLLGAAWKVAKSSASLGPRDVYFAETLGTSKVLFLDERLLSLLV